VAVIRLALLLAFGHVALSAARQRIAHNVAEINEDLRLREPIEFIPSCRFFFDFAGRTKYTWLTAVEAAISILKDIFIDKHYSGNH
jgi:hypothetical protein